MKRVSSVAVVVVVVAAGLFGLWRSRGPGGSGELARLVLPDGTEFRLSQQWQDYSEPYMVECWMRRPGAEWRWAYVDHESTRWRSASLELDLDHKHLLIRRGSKVQKVVAINDSTFVTPSEAGSSIGPPTAE